MRCPEKSQNKQSSRIRKTWLLLNSKSLFLTCPVTMAGHGRDGSHTSVELLFTEHQAMCVKDILLFRPHRTC